MSYQTSSAMPDRLAAFAARHAVIDEPLATASARAVADLSAFAARAGDFGTVGIDGLIPLSDLRTEAAHQAGWVRAVGEAFRAAGADPDGDGVVTARDADLPAGPASRSDHLAQLSAVLASLRQRAASGDLSVTADEFREMLATARHLVATAADPQAVAARILAPVGAGDIAVAVNVLADGPAPPSGGADSAAALADLGRLLSLGLEDQPARAERWARELTGARAAWGGAPYVDGLALLGGGNAPGTAVFGVALAAGLRSTGARTQRLGPVHLRYGTTDPLAPAVAAAGARAPDGRFSQVPLAHGIVADLAGTDRGRALVASFGGGASDVHDRARADALRAAVDPTVPAPARVRLALDLAARYRQRHELLPTFPDLELYGPAVTSGLGAATQPLLEHWRAHGDTGTIDVPADGGAVSVPDGALWATVGDLAEEPGGAEGLGAALGGATTRRLAAGAAAYQGELRADAGASAVAPLAPNSLRELGQLYTRTAVAAGNARFQAIAGHVERGPTTEDAIRPIVNGALGEIPGGSVAAGGVHTLELATTEPPEVTGGGAVTRGLEPSLTAALVRLDLAHRPDLATEAVTRALREAEAAGPTGVYDLIHGDDQVSRTGAGRELSELQALVTAQEDVVDVRLATGLDRALALDDGGS